MRKPWLRILLVEVRPAVAVVNGLQFGILPAAGQQVDGSLANQMAEFLLVALLQDRVGISLVQQMHPLGLQSFVSVEQGFKFGGFHLLHFGDGLRPLAQTLLLQVDLLDQRVELLLRPAQAGFCLVRDNADGVGFTGCHIFSDFCLVLAGVGDLVLPLDLGLSLGLCASTTRSLSSLPGVNRGRVASAI